MRRPKLVVLSTLVLFLTALAGGILFPEKPPMLVGHVDVTGYPTLGSRLAPVQMIIFEEPQCTSCRNFHLQTLPLLKERFIDTGKVQCTVVMLSFLENSEPFALASYAVFEQQPERFFPFLNELYADLPVADSEELQVQLLIEKFSGIDVTRLKEALADGHLKALIDKHENLGWTLMHDDFATPTVFINGVKTKSYSLGSLNTTIEKALKVNN